MVIGTLRPALPFAAQTTKASILGLSIFIFCPSLTRAGHTRQRLQGKTKNEYAVFNQGTRHEAADSHKAKPGASY